MKDEALQEELTCLVGYMLASARGLYEEPANYGPFRLIDAAGRLLAIMERAGLDDETLRELKQGIDEHRFGRSDDMALQAFLDQACVTLANRFREWR